MFHKNSKLNRFEGSKQSLRYPAVCSGRLGLLPYPLGGGLSSLWSRHSLSWRLRAFGPLGRFFAFGTLSRLSLRLWRNLCSVFVFLALVSTIRASQFFCQIPEAQLSATTVQRSYLTKCFQKCKDPIGNVMPEAHIHGNELSAPEARFDWRVCGLLLASRCITYGA